LTMLHIFIESHRDSRILFAFTFL